MHGLDGLKDLPPIVKSHLMTMPAEVVADRGPGAGASGLRVGPDRGVAGVGGPPGPGDYGAEDPQRRGTGSRHERWLALEQQNADQVMELSPEQVAFLEELDLSP